MKLIVTEFPDSYTGFPITIYHIALLVHLNPVYSVRNTWVMSFMADACLSELPSLERMGRAAQRMPTCWRGRQAPQRPHRRKECDPPNQGCSTKEIHSPSSRHHYQKKKKKKKFPHYYKIPSFIKAWIPSLQILTFWLLVI